MAPGSEPLLALSDGHQVSICTVRIPEELRWAHIYVALGSPLSPMLSIPMVLYIHSVSFDLEEIIQAFVLHSMPCITSTQAFHAAFSKCSEVDQQPLIN